MMLPLVRELAANGIAVAVTCRILKFSRQAFYAGALFRSTTAITPTR